MEDLGFFVRYRLAATDNGNCYTLLQLSAASILGLVYRISAVVAEGNRDNGAYIDTDTIFLPHQLVRILPRDFSVYMQRHRERLDYTFSIEDIENIGSQEQGLVWLVPQPT